VNTKGLRRIGRGDLLIAAIALANARWSLAMCRTSGRCQAYRSRTGPIDGSVSDGGRGRRRHLPQPGAAGAGRAEACRYGAGGVRRGRTSRPWSFRSEDGATPATGAGHCFGAIGGCPFPVLRRGPPGDEWRGRGSSSPPHSRGRLAGLRPPPPVRPGAAPSIADGTRSGRSGGAGWCAAARSHAVQRTAGGPGSRAGSG
jgi:hypothetical protein